MSMDAKPTVTTPATPPTIKHREKGIRIFMWPKVIYIFPSAIVALICAIGMWSLKEKSYDPSKPGPVVTSTSPDAPGTATPAPAKMSQRDRFTTPQNLLGVLFLAVLGFNLLVMALDFPRFELVGVILLTLFALFFVLWLGAFFNLDLMRPINSNVRVDLRLRQRRLLFRLLSDGAGPADARLRHSMARLLGGDAQRDPPPPRPLERPGTVPDHEPEVRQGDPRRARVRLARGGAAGAARSQRARSRWCSTTSCSSTRRKRRSRS